MHSTQSQLFADHHNFQRLLNCFEAELAWYEKDQPWRANLAIILDIFDYIQFYPETYHHPSEEAVYELLLQKEVEQSEVIRALKAEHRELEEVTRRARTLFNAIANDSVVPVNKLVEVSREFLERQREHIRRENEIIYPLLSAHVSHEEWERVTQELEEQRDPLFSEAIEEEYSSLYDAILEAEGDVIGATARAINTPPSKGKGRLLIN